MMTPETVPAARRTLRPVAARGAMVAVLAWLTLALAAGPAGAQYPPQPEIAVGTPGAVIFIEGSDWSPDTQVTVTYRDQDGQTAAATTTVGPDGRFTAPVTIPADAAPGELALSVTGTGADGAPREWSPTARVVPDDATRSATPAPEVTPAAALPTTGTPTGPGLVAAAVLLMLGAVALVAARARSRG